MCSKTIIKNRLRKLREDKEFSRQYVSDETGVPLDTLIAWEYGRNRAKVENIQILADFYGVSLDYIAGRTDNPEINK